MVDNYKVEELTGQKFWEKALKAKLENDEKKKAEKEEKERIHNQKVNELITWLNSEEYAFIKNFLRQMRSSIYIGKNIVLSYHGLNLKTIDVNIDDAKHLIEEFELTSIFDDGCKDIQTYIKKEMDSISKMWIKN
jgi:hypothetical protein